MSYLADAFQVAILIWCIIGLSLAGKHFLPSVDYSLHFCFTPLIVVGVLFCLEHFFPLGQAHFLWIPGSVLSFWLIQKYRVGLLRQEVLWYFLFGFFLCFFWRYTQPDIFLNSERIADHAHLVSYSAGGLLPAEDIWLKGNKDDMYYIFQYYAAGLIHRWTGASSGMTFHLGYCTLVGLAIAGVGTGARALAGSSAAGWCAAICIGLGGSGSTLVAPVMLTGEVNPAGAMRFIGCFALHGNPFLTPFGHQFINFIGESSVDAPMEYYSYVIRLGDFHPSLSSLLFFGLGVAAMGVAERAPANSPTDRYAMMAAVATAVYLFISNTWIAPLQVMLMICWLVYRRLSGKPDTLGQILLAWCVPFALIFPYFSQFAYETRNMDITIEWASQRAPVLNWMLVMGPAMLMWLLCVWHGLRSRLEIFIVTVCGGAIVGTYLFHVHDVYGGQYNVFNTTLKWWPWAYALMLVWGIAICWNAPIFRRLIWVIVVLTMMGNLWILGRDWYFDSKEHMGRLDGYAWFTEKPEQRAIFEVLESLPRGVVMESVPFNPGGPCITVAQFSGHYSLGGWVGHEMLWRGAREDLVNLADGRDAFYNGKLEDPVNWLTSATPGGVDYIVWLERDNVRGPYGWPGINASIESAYVWKEVARIGETRWGIWIRRTHPTPPESLAKTDAAADAKPKPGIAGPPAH
ncbi:MAG: DUF2298 domain-containing protein [Methylacidiphilales bacterium]|nr:DUF2298 domain-containing protein [Candidatus Methylacidiphilales bacterium]